MSIQEAASGAAWPGDESAIPMIHHYSCTCLERQEGRPTTWLSELERSHVGLKFGSHLLETVDRQMISGAQIVLVVVLVHGAISRPAA
jgi:hypothetical protein